MKLLKSFSNRFAADSFVANLTEEKIDYIIQADDCGGLRPDMAIQGGVNIYVDDGQYTKAVELLGL